MTDKEAVRTVHPHAMIERIGEDWLIRKYPEGRILSGGLTPAKAWHSARMNLFAENVKAALSEIPVAEK